MFAHKAPTGYVAEHAAKAMSPFEGVAHHNLQRKAAIIHGGAVNHGKDVFLIPVNGFDLDKTIFASVHGKFGMKRLIMKARLGNEPCWKEEKREEIEKEFQEYVDAPEHAIIRAPKYNRDVLDFMENECNFKCEHADGTFMDHLYFCHDYSAVHYKQQSPMVLFLHSIMGVGTNIFPMEASKTDKLASLLTADEFKHIEAFPSILRLVNVQKLTKELLAKKDKLDRIEKITFHRVIDNKLLELSAEDLWVALNFQMVHQLDFLPSTNWKSEVKDPLFQVFMELYTLLTTTGMLQAEVNIDLKSPAEVDEFGQPLTLANFISSLVPQTLKRSESIKSIQDFSAKIGHSLNYSITWKE